jgi:hypothetical protein
VTLLLIVIHTAYIDTENDHNGKDMQCRWAGFSPDGNSDFIKWSDENTSHIWQF